MIPLDDLMIGLRRSHIATIVPILGGASTCNSRPLYIGIPLLVLRRRRRPEAELLNTAAAPRFPTETDVRPRIRRVWYKSREVVQVRADRFSYGI